MVASTGTADTSYDPELRFAQGVDHLNYTLAASAFIGGPEQALLAVRRSMGPDVCPFVWRNGQVSLVYTGGDASLVTLSGVFDRCSAAIDGLR
jgi:hypothetical protein